MPFVSWIALHILLFIGSFVSFRYLIERYLTPQIGMGWSYIIDQTLPLIVTLIVALFALKRTGLQHIIRAIHPHRFLLVILFVTAVATHIGVMWYYFWSDEVVWMLNPITNNTPFFFHADVLKGYFVTSYAFWYLVAGVEHVWMYNAATLFYFGVSVVIGYLFLYLLTKRKTISFISALFFATTPSFFDMFTWHSTGYAPIFILGLISFIFLLQFMKTDKRSYYILSILFYFTAIKMGFIRSFPFISIVFFLIFFPPLTTAFKKSLRTKILYIIPFVAISAYFAIFDFFYPEIVVFFKQYNETHKFADAVQTFVTYRDVRHPNLIAPKLFYFITHLFIPSGIVKELLAFFEQLDIHPTKSLVLTAGSYVVTFLSLLFGISSFSLIFSREKTTRKWLTVFAIFFVFATLMHYVIGYQGIEFQTGTRYTDEQLDIQFSREHLGYGPGSRYLYVPAFGVSMLFGLAITECLKRMKLRVQIIGVFVVLAVTGTNIYLLARSQIMNIKNLQSYRYLPEQIFKFVPRDGSKKIIYSTNPEKNSLETKFASWKWMHGFYKFEEFNYTNNAKELIRQIQSDEFTRENIYAFYTNPHTLTFADVTQDARKALFDQNIEETRLLSEQYFAEVGISAYSPSSLMKRAMVHIEPPIRRYVLPMALKFKMFTTPKNIPYPATDGLLSDDPIFSIIPSAVWNNLSPQPIRIERQKPLQKYLTIASKQKLLSDIPNEERMTLLRILNTRSLRKQSLSVSATSLASSPIATISALSDGNFAAYPALRQDDRIYQAEALNTTITVSLTSPIKLGRILINTPHAHTSAAPQTTSILINGKHIETKTTQAALSPNNGIMQVIEIAGGIETKTFDINIVNNKAAPIIDEITIDDVNALSFPVEYLIEFEQKAPLYIDDFAYATLLSQAFPKLTIIYACAEDTDWQKQLQNMSQTVQGIWRVQEVHLLVPSEALVNTPLFCMGSILRSIIIIAPPYPSTMRISNLVIEKY